MTELEIANLIINLPITDTNYEEWHDYICGLFKIYNIQGTGAYSFEIYKSIHKEKLIRDINRWKLLHS